VKKRYHAIIILIITVAAIYLSANKNTLESSHFFNNKIDTQEPYNE